jgi:endonuclease III related protein
MNMKTIPTNIYDILFSYFGPRQWWPMDRDYHKYNNSDQRFEVIVGAILTQNTAWSNVEKAIENLKNAQMLSIDKINKCNINRLKNHIRPSGFFNQKAKRLQIISRYLQQEYHGDLDTFFSQSLPKIRTQLLSLNGIGPETADSILLYAGQKPVFVVDAYTKRLCHRLDLPVNHQSYDDIQHYFSCDLLQSHGERQLVQVFNECHAIIVEWAKKFCRKRNPMCSACPLHHLCSYKENRNSQQL